jgi:hypothetical protein
MGRARFGAVAVDSLGEEPRWSAGRRRAPEAGGSRKRIVLWRAPRPKRERVVTFARVARPTTLAPPGAPLPPLSGSLADGFCKNSDAQRVARTDVYCNLSPRFREGSVGGYFTSFLPVTASRFL